MNQQSRKQIGQIVLLVVLLVGLGFSVLYMIKTVNQRGSGRRSAARPAVTAEEPAAQPAAAETAEAPATDAEAIPAEVEAHAVDLNENLFQVFGLSPPKNPFVREERWYEEELAQVPGYPELRDEGFFEGMDAYIPPLDELLDEGDVWLEAQLSKREMDENYTLSGQSDDGMISTNLQLTGPPGDLVDVRWHPGSGVPLTALQSPGWEQQFDLQAATEQPDLPSADDLFQPPSGLPIPGIDSVLAGGMVGGDQIVCHGISGEGERATALVRLNEMTQLVGPGDALPPRYQVEAVTADGVVLTELRSGETLWLPLSAPISGDQASSSLPAAPAPPPASAPATRGSSASSS